MNEMADTHGFRTAGTGDLRRVDVFFYGMFMDADIVRGAGVAPAYAEIAILEGYELRIGNRAAVVPRESARVFGVVMSLTLHEVAQLYSEESLAAYRPEPVLVSLASGQKTAALCYNLAEPPPPGIGNREYAAKLREVARKVGLPTDYVASVD